MESDYLEYIDDKIILGLVTKTWYSFVQLKINLLRNHILEIEKQINLSIKAYEKESEPTHVEHDKEGVPTVIFEQHRGVEGPPSYLTEIFEYYFPSLQRRSALTTLFSFLEHELDQLCTLFSSENTLNIVHTDLKDKGIDRSRRYLKKVVNLELDDSSSNWQEIKNIQKVRNIIVHNNGKLIDEKLIIYVQGAKYLTLASESGYYIGEIDEVNIDEVNILEGYLTYVLDTFDLYCHEIDKIIQVHKSS